MSNSTCTGNYGGMRVSLDDGFNRYPFGNLAGPITKKKGVRTCAESQSKNGFVWIDRGYAMLNYCLFVECAVVAICLRKSKCCSGMFDIWLQSLFEL